MQYSLQEAVLSAGRLSSCKQQYCIAYKKLYFILYICVRRTLCNRNISGSKSTLQLYDTCRKLYQGVVAAVKTTEIHPELTLEQIQNPPDNRRGVLRSLGSRYTP